MVQFYCAINNSYKKQIKLQQWGFTLYTMFVIFVSKLINKYEYNEFYLTFDSVRKAKK